MSSKRSRSPGNVRNRAAMDDVSMYRRSYLYGLRDAAQQVWIKGITRTATYHWGYYG